MVSRDALLPAVVVCCVAGALLVRSRRRAAHAHNSYCKIAIASTASARPHSHAIRTLVEVCFPDEIDDEDSKEELERDALSVLSGFHNVDDCEWLLAWRDGVLIGLAMAVAYHDSLYVASLCTHPAHRRRGVGAALMRSASAHAAVRGLPALSGSVYGKPHLVRFYEALGGSMQPNHAIASSSAPAPSMRLRAPSGVLTSHGVAAPRPLESVHLRAK